MRPAACDFKTTARVFFCFAVMVVSRWITRGRTGKEQGMKKKDDKHVLDICGVMEFLREKLLRQQPPYHGKTKNHISQSSQPLQNHWAPSLERTFGGNFMVKLYPLSICFFLCSNQECRFRHSGLENINFQGVGGGVSPLYPTLSWDVRLWDVRQ